MDPDSFLAGCKRRFGRANPERFDEGVWQWLAERALDPAVARRELGLPSNFGGSGPDWCLRRFGTSETALPGGRTLYVAGEHEDWYDPDFCIYNDAIVREPHAGPGHPQERARAVQDRVAGGVDRGGLPPDLDPDHPGDDQVRDHRHAVVEQALALDDRVQAPVDAQGLEQRQHADRVGGRHDRREQERRSEIEPVDAGGPEREPGDRRGERGRHDHARPGEHQRHQRVAAEPLPVEVERRLEQQRRQQQQQQQVRREPDLLERLEVQQPEPEPGHDQGERVGQVEPSRHHADRRGDQEQGHQRFDRVVHPYSESALHDPARPRLHRRPAGFAAATRVSSGPC
jgi:hypothetical protein